MPGTSSDLPRDSDGPPVASLYLVLHQVGFTQLLRSPEELVRSYRTISPLPRRSKAVYFLLHLPSRYRDSTLWSTLPYGVRTFLPSRKGGTSDHLACSDRKIQFRFISGIIHVMVFVSLYPLSSSTFG